VGGQGAVVEGDSANDLLGVTMDPNVFIQNSKYVAGTIVPGRRPRGPELVDFVEKYQREAGLTTESGNQQVTAPESDVEAAAAAGTGHSVGGHPHRGGDSAVGVTPGKTLGGETVDAPTVESADDRTGRVDLQPVETVDANTADDGDASDGDPDHGRDLDGSAVTDSEVRDAEAERAQRAQAQLDRAREKAEGAEMRGRRQRARCGSDRRLRHVGCWHRLGSRWTMEQ
jgi:formate dehydrogenase major subunit